MFAAFRAIYGLLHTLDCPPQMVDILCRATVRLAQQAAKINDRDKAYAYLDEYMTPLPRADSESRAYALRCLAWHTFDKMRWDDRFVAHWHRAEEWVHRA